MSKASYHLVNRTVPIERLLDKLGYERNEKGFISCPFHPDKTPSLKVYGGENGWYCFSCNHGGGSVEFLARLRSISKSKAVKVLQNSFRLKLDTFKERSKLHRFKQQQKDEIEKEVMHQFERDICSKVVPFIFEVPDGPVREALYTAWIGHCLNLIDRAKYWAYRTDSLKPLKGVLLEITDFLIWTLDMYIEEENA